MNESDKSNEKPENDVDIVTPWEVASSSATGVDYDKLIGTRNEIFKN